MSVAVTDLYKYIYSFELREKMKKQDTFNEIEKEWSLFFSNPFEEFGLLRYIIREAHFKKAKKYNNNDSFITREEWEKYYFWSGSQRKRKQDKNPKSDTYKTNMYYGRTIEEIVDSATKFLSFHKEKSDIKLTLQSALNFIIVKILDNTYENYQRQMNTILNLKSKFPECVFELTDELVCESSAVDVFVYKNDEMVSGIQISDEHEEKSQSPETKSEQEQKHKLFEIAYGLSPQKIYSSTTGLIKGALPNF